MEPVVLFLGFATLAGLLAGYILGRNGPVWSVLTLWGVTAAVGVCAAIWLDAGDGPSMSIAPAGLYALIGFGIAALPAGVLGVVVRMVVARGSKP